MQRTLFPKYICGTPLEVEHDSSGTTGWPGCPLRPDGPRVKSMGTGLQKVHANVAQSTPSGFLFFFQFNIFLYKRKGISSIFHKLFQVSSYCLGLEGLPWKRNLTIAGSHLPHHANTTHMWTFEGTMSVSHIAQIQYGTSLELKLGKKESELGTSFI